MFWKLNCCLMMISSYRQTDNMKTISVSDAQDCASVKNVETNKTININKNRSVNKCRNLYT